MVIFLLAETKRTETETDVSRDPRPNLFWSNHCSPHQRNHLRLRSLHLSPPPPPPRPAVGVMPYRAHRIDQTSQYDRRPLVCEYSRYDVIMECRTPALQCGLEHQKIFTKTSEFWEQFYFCFFISFVSFKPQTSQTNLFWIFFFFVKLSSNIFELLSYLFFFKILLSITIF